MASRGSPFAIVSLGCALGCALACSSPASPPTASPAPAAAPAPEPPPPAAPASAPRTASVVRHAVIRFGKLAGHSVVTTEPDGTLTAAVEDSGGPNLNATLTLAADGTIARWSSSGRRQHGAEVRVTFARDGDRASWTSVEETAERDVHGAAFYVPADEIPDVEGWLIQAALRNGGTMPLLPGGTARIENTGEVAVVIDGAPRTLTGYAIVGLDLAPVQNWMNPDGSWFGFVSRSFSVVPEGADEAIAPLVAKQDELFRARDARLATELAHRPPPAGLAYTHARVLDVERGRWLRDQTVLVIGDKIAWVGPSRWARIPRRAEVVDVAGKALLPGLIDMFAQSAVTGNVGALHIASGVTTVRDVGNVPDDLADLQERFDRGTAVGPHVVRFGRIDGRGDRAAPGATVVDSVEEAAVAVRFFIEHHYDGIALWSSLRPELLPAIANAAHRADLPVTGVAPAHMRAADAVRAGYDGIERISMLVLDLLDGHDVERGAAEYALIGELAPALNLAAAPARQLIQLLRGHKTIVEPLVNTLERFLIWEPGKIAPGLESMVARLPVQVQRVFLGGGAAIAPENRARYRASFDKVLALTRRLYAAKVPLVAGTNGLAGLAYHRELALFVRAGIRPADVLRIATIDAARYLHRDRLIGSIAPRKLADLVLIDGDPLANITDLGRTVSTMRAGIEYPAAPLYASAGIAPLAPR